jgi:hypothetical protein
MQHSSFPRLCLPSCFLRPSHRIHFALSCQNYFKLINEISHIVKDSSIYARQTAGTNCNQATRAQICFSNDTQTYVNKSKTSGRNGRGYICIALIIRSGRIKSNSYFCQISTLSLTLMTMVNPFTYPDRFFFTHFRNWLSHANLIRCDVWFLIKNSIDALYPVRPFHFVSSHIRTTDITEFAFSGHLFDSWLLWESFLCTVSDTKVSWIRSRK